MGTAFFPPGRPQVPIRTVTQADLEATRRSNDESVPAMNPAILDRLEWCATEAADCRVAEFGRQMAGFLICFRPGAHYASPNSRWFKERFE